MKPITEPLRSILESLGKSAPPNQIMGIKTGFNHLDEMTSGLNKGELIVIGARPGIVEIIMQKIEAER